MSIAFENGQVKILAIIVQWLKAKCPDWRHAFFAIMCPTLYFPGRLILRYSPRENNPNANRIIWADGIRGLMALSIVWGHSQGIIAANYPDQAFPYMGVNFGYICVPVFLFLSGFVLTLPTVNRGLSLGSIYSYIEKRANRILPAYFAAVALSLVLGIYVSHVYHLYNIVALDPEFLGAIFLMSDFKGWGGTTFNSPLYSMPIEWHFYFLLPVILWLFRKRGPHAVAFALALATCLANKSLQPTLYYVHAYLFTTFVLGCYSAWFIASGQTKLPSVILSKALWFSLTLFVGLAAMPGDTLGPTNSTVPILSVLFSGWLFLLFSYMYGNENSMLRRLFETKLSQQLGLFSYSIYLCHYPVELCIAHYLGHRMPFAQAVLVMAVLSIACALPVAYCIYWLFERPYLLRSKHAKARLSSVSTISPLPDPCYSVPTTK